VARPTAEFRRYALMGAEQRLVQIAAEAESIYRTFPELRRSDRVAATDNGGLTSTTADSGRDNVPSPLGQGVRGLRKSRGPGRPRNRRTMSADARRRISEAQKARWAKQKAEVGGQKPAGKKK
jgi:hypothetical protein